jgi:pyruvate/2-oxoglutarate dehydrogenase complex dihydrolipoamide dehydrogenase (E3) component
MNRIPGSRGRTPIASKDRYDLVVLGGGTAGLVSSVIAASVGARVALVERDRTGGDCLWTGCVPSKSLIASARLAEQMRTAGKLGLAGVEPEIELGRVMDRAREAIATIEPHDSPERLRDEGVEVIAGEGRFEDAHTLAVGDRRLRFRVAIVATGSQPALPPVPGLESAAVSTTDTIWELRELPSRLVVLGGGPIGCELGQAFGRLGSDVVMVELTDRLLGKEEPEASALIAERLGGEGVEVRLRTQAAEVRNGAGDRAEIVLEGPSGRGATAFDRILVATGRRPRTADLGLEAAGVEVDRSGAVVVDERLRTTAAGIYAAGDVTGRLPVTHVAAHHARVASVNALFGGRRTVEETIPWVTFTDPEVARVGLSGAQARERWGAEAQVARSEYSSLDRAITDARAYGFALLVADPRGRLVGATVAAPGGGEAIAELAARVRNREKIDSVSTTVHAYPTLAEGPARAADEHLRRRYSSRGYRVLARSVLGARRLFARLSG